MNFNERYDRESFRKFLRDSFLPEDYKPEETELQFPTKTEYSTRALKLGHSRSLDLDVYEIHHTSSHDARVTISREAFRLLFEENRDFALALFVPEGDPGHYRFSLIEMQISIDGAGLRRTYSNPRRYSYLLGEGIACHTPDEYLLGKGRVQSKEDLRERFSVEVLTRQFYNELFAWYEWALKPESGVTFPNLVTTPDDDRDNLKVKLIRLLTRLIFVWFIKQKELVPGELFDEAALDRVLKDFDPVSKTSGSYYNAVLQNLFFATLNRAITDDHGGHRGFAERRGKPDLKTLYRYAELFSISEAEVVELFSKVPFLNGGLFECLDKTAKLDGVESAYYYDGFSRNDARFKNGSYRHRAFVPNVLFFEEERGLLPIFKRYNFTIEENSPSDVQVALDPELLGKVFENLLGVYNEETEETARKQSGSFYTPREIVDYMVCESLKAYFKAACPGLPEGELQKLFEDSPELSLSQGERETLIDAIFGCRILDPACGSGAFPMGILQRLCHALRLLDPGNKSWEQHIVQAAKAKLAEAIDSDDERERNAKIESVRDTFNKQKAHPDFTRKLYLIENCIHGVDIQPIAIQISKLRFFISLICEQEPNKDASGNYGVLPLPNLETNLVCANTLLAKQAGGPPTFTDPAVEALKRELLDIRDAHFNASSAAKKEALRTKDEATRKKLAHALAESGFYTKSDAEQLALWDPYDQNAVASFFDPEWMFGMGSFDVVLGNPPYIQLQKDGGKLGKLYEPCGYATFARTGDIYCLFYERGLSLCRAGGATCFITSNKWMRAGYGEATRAFLAGKRPRLLVDFGGLQVFESATVDTNILLVQNAPPAGGTLCCTVKGTKSLKAFDLAGYVRDSAAHQAFSTAEAWTILSPVEQAIRAKIEAAGVPLKDWDVQINYGIKTGFNDAFIISTDKRDEILSNCKSQAERNRTERLIRKVLRGRDIKRYGYQWAGLWLVWVPWHFPLHMDESIQGASAKAEKEFARQYPAVYAHLLQYKGQLEKRNKAETGIRYEWYAMQRWGANYWQDFDKPKIVYAELMRMTRKDVNAFPRFAVIDADFLTDKTAYFFVGGHLNSLCYMLNSTYAAYYFLNNAGILDKGGVMMNKMYVENIPLPKSLADATDIDDEAIYKAFGFTDEEVAFIEGFIAQRKAEIVAESR